MSELLAIGSTAPSFTARANDGSTISLEDLLKKGSVPTISPPARNSSKVVKAASISRSVLARSR